MSTTYFTQDFTKLSDQRKLEVMITELSRIACYNDADTDEFYDVLKQLADLRSVVA
jgi:hypothetical protein